VAKWIRFEKVTFNADWAASKTFEYFRDHEKHHGIPDEKMKEIHEAARKVTGWVEPQSESES
jgi:hypothetical protein